jgi:hypothetical protein
MENRGGLWLVAKKIKNKSIFDRIYRIDRIRKNLVIGDQ